MGRTLPPTPCLTGGSSEKEAAGAAGATQERPGLGCHGDQRVARYGSTTERFFSVSEVFRCALLLRVADSLFAEEADVAGPSDLIMTRGNRGDEEEEGLDSDTDDLDHTGEKTDLQTYRRGQH